MNTKNAARRMRGALVCAMLAAFGFVVAGPSEAIGADTYYISGGGGGGASDGSGGAPGGSSGAYNADPSITNSTGMGHGATEGATGGGGGGAWVGKNTPVNGSADSSSQGGDAGVADLPGEGVANGYEIESAANGGANDGGKGGWVRGQVSIELGNADKLVIGGGDGGGGSTAKDANGGAGGDVGGWIGGSVNSTLKVNLADGSSTTGALIIAGGDAGNTVNANRIGGHGGNVAVDFIGADSYSFGSVNIESGNASWGTTGGKQAGGVVIYSFDGDLFVDDGDDGGSYSTVSRGAKIEGTIKGNLDVVEDYIQRSAIIWQDGRTPDTAADWGNFQTIEGALTVGGVVDIRSGGVLGAGSASGMVKTVIENQDGDEYAITASNGGGEDYAVEIRSGNLLIDANEFAATGEVIVDLTSGGIYAGTGSVYFHTGFTRGFYSSGGTHVPSFSNDVTVNISDGDVYVADGDYILNTGNVGSDDLTVSQLGGGSGNLYVGIGYTYDKGAGTWEKTGDETSDLYVSGNIELATGANYGGLANNASGTIHSHIAGDVVAGDDDEDNGNFTIATGSILQLDYGITGDIYSTIGGNVSLTGTLELTTGRNNGQRSSGDIVSIIGTEGDETTGSVFAENVHIRTKLVTYLDDPTNKPKVGDILSHITGDVYTMSGFDVLVNTSSGGLLQGPTDSLGLSGSIQTTVEGDLIVFGDIEEIGLSTIKFHAGNASQVGDGGSITAIEETYDVTNVAPDNGQPANDGFTDVADKNVVGGDIGALFSDLSIQGGNASSGSSEAWEGGTADITVGGSGRTKTQWTAYAESMKSAFTLGDEVWNGGDLVVQAGVSNDVRDDYTSLLAVVVNDIDLDGGDSQRYAHGDGGSATLTLEAEGAGVYAHGDIDVVSGWSLFGDGNGGEAGISLNRSEAITYTDHIGYTGTHTNSNVYVGGDVNVVARSDGAATFDGVGRVVFTDVDGDGASLILRNNSIGRTGTLTYNALSTDFSNLNRAGQTVLIEITADDVDNDTTVSLGELRYGLTNNIYLTDDAMWHPSPENDQMVFVDSVTASIAGSVINYRNYDWDEDYDSDYDNWADGVGAKFNADEDLVFNFEIGEDVSLDTDNARNVMSTYVNHIELNGNELNLRLNDEYDALNNSWAYDTQTGTWDLERTALTKGLADASFLLPEGIHTESIALIQNGTDGNRESFGADEHIEGGDHNRYVQTSDYDLIVSIWKGNNDAGQPDNSQILMGLTDARYLKGQSILHNRTASLGQMISGFDSNFDYLSNFASMRDECGGVTAFGNVGYSKSRFDKDTGYYVSDSKVKTKGMNALAGIGYRTANTDCNDGFFAGLFFEGGWGKYDAYDNYDLTGYQSNAIYSHGRGDINYYGGGLFLKKETEIGFKAILAGRIGRVDTDYRNRSVDFDVYENGYSISKFNINGMYYSASAALAWEIKPNSRNSIEPFAAFHWTRQSSKNGLRPYRGAYEQAARLDVDAIDSMRTQVGVKYAYTFMCNARGDTFKGYLSAGWEHEFDGKSTGNIWYGTNPEAVRIRNNTLKGSSGIGQVGFRYETNTRWFVDVSAHGSIGKRDSWGGNVGAGVTF